MLNRDDGRNGPFRPQSSDAARLISDLLGALFLDDEEVDGAEDEPSTDGDNSPQG